MTPGRARPAGRTVYILGHFSEPTSLEEFFGRAFKELGWHVVRIPTVDTGLAVARRVPRLRKATYKFLNRGRVESLIMAAVSDSDALILVVKGEELISSNSLLRLINSARGRVVVYAPDALATFAADGTPSRLADSGVALATYCPKDAAAYQMVGGRALVVPFAYDPGCHWRSPVAGLVQSRNWVTFVGTWDHERERAVRAVAEYVQVHVYGRRWERADDLGRATIVSAEAVFGDHLAHLVQQSAAVLNIARKQNWASSNMRGFETPAQGGIAANLPALPQVPAAAQPVTGLDPDHLGQQLLDLMSTSRERRLDLVRAGQTAAQPHTYADRVLELVAWLDA